MVIARLFEQIPVRAMHCLGNDLAAEAHPVYGYRGRPRIKDSIERRLAPGSNGSFGRGRRRRDSAGAYVPLPAPSREKVCGAGVRSRRSGSDTNWGTATSGKDCGRDLAYASTCGPKRSTDRTPALSRDTHSPISHAMQNRSSRLTGLGRQDARSGLWRGADACAKARAEFGRSTRLGVADASLFGFLSPAKARARATLTQAVQRSSGAGTFALYLDARTPAVLPHARCRRTLSSIRWVAGEARLSQYRRGLAASRPSSQHRRWPVQAVVRSGLRLRRARGSTASDRAQLSSRYAGSPDSAGQQTTLRRGVEDTAARENGHICGRFFRPSLESTTRIWVVGR